MHLPGIRRPTGGFWSAAAVVFSMWAAALDTMREKGSPLISTHTHNSHL
jgi:hypothetical protein